VAGGVNHNQINTMKKTFAAIILASTIATHAGIQVFMGGLVTVNNTTSNSPAVTAVSAIAGPGGSIVIQHGALAATNNFYIDAQVSLDQTNYVTVARYYPASTNAGSEVWIPSYTMPPLYFRGSCTSTNSVQVGGFLSN
jgi:hypothetical protein